MVNSPLIRPYLLGGSFGGGTLGSHDYSWLENGHAPECFVDVFPIKNGDLPAIAMLGNTRG